jgi:hypothetical protein
MCNRRIVESRNRRALGTERCTLSAELLRKMVILPVLTFSVLSAYILRFTSHVSRFTSFIFFFAFCLCTFALYLRSN